MLTGLRHGVNSFLWTTALETINVSFKIMAGTHVRARQRAGPRIRCGLLSSRENTLVSARGTGALGRGVQLHLAAVAARAYGSHGCLCTPAHHHLRRCVSVAGLTGRSKMRLTLFCSRLFLGRSCRFATGVLEPVWPAGPHCRRCRVGAAPNLPRRGMTAQTELYSGVTQVR